MSIDLPPTAASLPTPAQAPPVAAADRLPLASPEAVALRLPHRLRQLLRCPRCQGPLTAQGGADDPELSCRSPACGQVFPIAEEVPILIDESRSLFDIATFLQRDPTFFKQVGWLRRTVSRCLPDPSANVAAPANFAAMREILVQQSDRPIVLVVGGGVVGSGLEAMLDDPRITFLETDAAIGPRTQLICDGHDLPLADASVDGVIVQAVLEHVVDPHRCVAEIARVLKPAGLVYSDTPFIQQVHGREFDFTRFTRLGHRRLFRQFEMLRSGISCGPGMALAWTLRYFLLSFVQSARARAVVSGFSRLAFFWLIYLDRFLAHRPAASDAASAFYFLGRKSDSVLSDRDLIADYRGGF